MNICNICNILFLSMDIVHHTVNPTYIWPVFFLFLNHVVALIKHLCKLICLINIGCLKVGSFRFNYFTCTHVYIVKVIVHKNIIPWRLLISYLLYLYLSTCTIITEILFFYMNFEKKTLIMHFFKINLFNKAQKA